jgi:hypothetical protein
VSTGTKQSQASSEGPTDAPAEPVRRWGLLAIVAGAAIVLALLALLVVRVVISNARPALGVTAVANLQPGSCLAEAATDSAEYTVVDCSTPHPQQMIAMVDLSLGREVFTSYGAMPALAQEVCDRYLEYDLFVGQAAGDDRLSVVPLGLPSEAEYDSGRTVGFCAVVATDGSDLTTDEYRPVR